MVDWKKITPVSVEEVLKYNKTTKTKVYGYPTTVMVTIARAYYTDIAVMIDGRLPCYLTRCYHDETNRDALLLKEAEKNKQRIVVGGEYKPNERILEIEFFEISQQK
jgi:hypothetical protein